MQTYTRKEVAELLGVTTIYLAGKKMAQKLPFMKTINNKVFYDKKLVDEYINNKLEELGDKGIKVI
jgi:hypothetical protein